MNLKDKVAILSGSTGALGTAVTQSFLDAGARVVALYSRESSLESLKTKVTQNSERLSAIRTDVLNEASVQGMVKEVLENHRTIDILVNLVGGFFGGVSIVETSEEQWDKMMGLNLKSVFLCCRNVLPAMMKQKSGRIITMGSRSGVNAVSGMSAYSASKAGLINFTEALAAEGRARNITANVVIPSIMDTSDNRKAMPDANFANWVKVEMIAETILFLCSETAGDINGAVIPVYGKS
ncbi:SDR family oxidoreductase [candidate division KSB1 bacterium]|nr:SDR family oxidoreductase [candidate division KSB1 bacterium]TDJ02733.1 MAG: SDR family oxidoreductase [Caldithrix sp.]